MKCLILLIILQIAEYDFGQDFSNPRRLSFYGQIPTGGISFAKTIIDRYFSGISCQIEVRLFEQTLHSAFVEVFHIKQYDTKINIGAI